MYNTLALEKEREIVKEETALHIYMYCTRTMSIECQYMYICIYTVHVHVYIHQPLYIRRYT